MSINVKVTKAEINHGDAFDDLRREYRGRTHTKETYAEMAQWLFNWYAARGMSVCVDWSRYPYGGVKFDVILLDGIKAVVLTMGVVV